MKRLFLLFVWMATLNGCSALNCAGGGGGHENGGGCVGGVHFLHSQIAKFSGSPQ